MSGQGRTHQYPQRIVVAGVLSFGFLLASCQQAGSHAPSSTGPADVSSVATMQEPCKATRAPAADEQDLPAEACVKSEEGFSEFFGHFVQDRKVRESHSAPMIEVGDIKKDDETKNVVASDQIEPFRIALVDSRWVYEEPGKPPGELARVDTNRTLDGNTMRVEFVRAEFSSEEDVLKTMGDPEAYIFAFRKGCWQLTKYLH
jgi:hypothetical protein